MMGMGWHTTRSDVAQPWMYCPHCRGSFRKPKYETPLYCLRCGTSLDEPIQSAVKRAMEAA